jgi:hypothetical protein
MIRGSYKVHVVQISSTGTSIVRIGLVRPIRASDPSVDLVQWGRANGADQIGLLKAKTLRCRSSLRKARANVYTVQGLSPTSTATLASRSLSPDWKEEQIPQILRVEFCRETDLFGSADHPLKCMFYQETQVTAA